jgi:4-carboxymuconolactone decarboxylase
MSRIPELSRDELDADGQQLYDEILAVRGSIAGPFRVWLYSPEFTRRATQLGEFLRYHTSLSPRLSELVILTTARRQNRRRNGRFTSHWHARPACPAT